MFPNKKQFTFGIIEDDDYWQERYISDLNAPNWKNAFTFPSFEEFIKQVDTILDVDVVLVDILLPGISGIDALLMLQKYIRPDTRIIIISGMDCTIALKAAIKKGIQGYITKANYPPNLRESLEGFLQAEGAILSADISRKLMDEVRKEDSVYYDTDLLAHKEWLILQRIAEGDTYKQAALNLHMSINTFRYYIKKIYKIIGVNSGREAVNWYVKRREKVDTKED